MFLDFFLFEFKLRMKSISTYVYFALWFLMVFFSRRGGRLRSGRRGQSPAEWPLRHDCSTSCSFPPSA